MENLPTHKNHGNKRFENSENNQIANAIEFGVKIRHLDDDEPIFQSLRYVFTLVGIKGEQIPNKIETAVLLKFIRDNYSHFTADEIKIAFELAIKKQFPCETNHFGNFSPLYFANVMNSYMEMRGKVGAELMRIQQKELNEKNEATQAEIKQIQLEFWETIVEPMFGHFKQTNHLDFGITNPRFIYDSLRDKFPDILTNEQKAKIKIEAIENVEKMKHDIQNQKSINRAEFEKKKAFLDALGIPKENENAVISECYKIAIKIYFEKMIIWCENPKGKESN